MSKGYDPCKNCLHDDGGEGGRCAPFCDVSNSAAYADDIIWLSTTGISSGFPDGTFCPYEKVARCDIIACLYRLAGEPDYFASAEEMVAFSDIDISTPHAKEVWWLAAKGISKGYPNGTFKPYANVIRQDMAAFLHRMAERDFVTVK